MRLISFSKTLEWTDDANHRGISPYAGIAFSCDFHRASMAAFLSTETPPVAQVMTGVGRYSRSIPVARVSAVGREYRSAKVSSYGARSSTSGDHDDHTQIDAHHHHRDPCLSRFAIFGWEGFAAFFSHPPLIALAITLLVLSGVAVFSGGNLSRVWARIVPTAGSS
jgi:hypothetical protein